MRGVFIVKGAWIRMDLGTCPRLEAFHVDGARSRDVSPTSEELWFFGEVISTS